MKKWIFLVIGLLLFAGQGFSEPPDMGDDPAPAEQTKKVRERIETLRMWKLTEALDLSQAAASKLFPLLNEYDKKRFEAERGMKEDMQKLRSSLEKATDEELKGMLSKLEANHRRLEQLNEEEFAKLKEILTVKQQARYIVFKQDFEHNLRRMISDVRETRKKGPEGFEGRPPMGGENRPSDRPAPERPWR